MTIDLDSGSGLFDRLGRIKHVLNLFRTFFGTTVPAEVEDILEEYDGASTVIRDTVDSLLPDMVTAQGTPATFYTSLRTAAENTLIEMADADNPLPSRTVAVALDELIRQMETNSETVDASEPTISTLVTGPNIGTITAATQANPVQVTSAAHGMSNGDVVSIVGVAGMTEINNRQFYVANVATNTFELRGEDGTGHTAYSANGTWRSSHGTGTLIVSLLDGQGKTLENCLAEDLVLLIDTNSTAGGESGKLQGEVDRSSGNKLMHQWPSGSGVSVTVSVVNPTSGTLLTNGDMEAFTTNDPDNWTIDVGVAGTDIKEDTVDMYRGSSCLELDGDSVTLSEISQLISSSAISSRTPYPVSVRYKADVVPANGTLVIDLYDGTNVINDDSGTANSLTVNLNNSETSYLEATGVFRLPEPVPASVTVRVRLTVAISAGSSVFIDDIVFGPAMTSAYAGGPYVSLIRGDVDMAVDDEHTVTVVNARDGAWQEAFDQLFQNPTKLLPSVTGGGETISDALIG